MTREQHYCWMDATTFTGQLIVPRSDPNEYEWPFDFLFDTVEEAISRRDEELDEMRPCVSDSVESTTDADVAYVESWVLCRRTIEPVENVVGEMFAERGITTVDIERNLKELFGDAYKWPPVTSTKGYRERGHIDTQGRPFIDGHPVTVAQYESFTAEWRALDLADED